MKIGDSQMVSIDYVLTLDTGEEIDRSEPGSPLSFVFGSGQIIPGLEQALEGMQAGQAAKVVVEPEDAYGLSDPSLLQEIPRSQFPADMEIQEGQGFEATGPHGPMRFLVKSVSSETVLVDFNHVLAGERLHFDVKVAGVREATPQELAMAAQEHEPVCGGSCCADEAGGCGSGCN